MAISESPTAFAQSLCKRSPARGQASDRKPRQEDAWRGRHPMGHAREEDGRGTTVTADNDSVRNNIGLLRFTLRGTTKVNIQWLLYCIVHNIGKIYRYGSGFA
jgi:hypothetical protein